jgi:hypothetical protein
MKSLAAVSAASLLLVLPVLGCRSTEGPAEETGRKVDDAIDKLTHPNEGPLEKSGRKFDEAVDDLRH